MLIERPPYLYRKLFPGSVWQLPEEEPCVYITFDDGPNALTTPRLLRLLDQLHVPATFFCVGDNVRRYPEHYRAILAAGHTVGNHTYHHIRGLSLPASAYMADVQQAAELIHSRLFRPPHGRLTPAQLSALRTAGYRIIMFDVVTRDYNPRLTPDNVFHIATRYARNGSLIVFHDSPKAAPRMFDALPRVVTHLRAAGYTFRSLEMP
ncbi:polysaccharide deacetylase [Tannerella sp. oral taxon 808]|nr:polysaccharide deacetylase [Tannerella sp. oral taxon 808]